MINITIKVLDSVSEEAELSPLPPMCHSDEATSAIKRKTQAPPESSASGGINLRKEKERGARVLSCVTGLNTKSKAVGLLYDLD